MLSESNRYVCVSKSVSKNKIPEARQEFLILKIIA